MAHSPEERADAMVSARVRTDLILGIVIALFGLLLIVWIIPAKVNDAGSFGLPPSLAPRSLAWLMVALGVILAAQNIRSVGSDPLAGSLTWGDVGHLAICVISVGAMLIVMGLVGQLLGRPYSGFWVAAPLGLLAFTLIHSGAPLWAYVFNMLAAPAVIYAAFWWGLQMPLP